MKLQTRNDRIHIVILDIQGLYAQIHDEMWISEIEYQQVKKVYGNYYKYRIIRL